MRAALRGVVVAGAAALGALFASGCLLAAHFEATGFTRRDAEPRFGYLALLALAFAASIVIPFALWRRLLPDAAPGWTLAAVVAVVGVVAILGMSPLGF